MTDALAWRPTIHLPDAEIRIADVTAPLSVKDRWRATLGGHIYFLAGTGAALDHRERVTGYLGITRDSASGRPWVSLTHWVRTVAALDVDTIALTTLRTERDPDTLRVLKCSMIGLLNKTTTYMLNTVTVAGASSRALGPKARRHAAHGELLGTVLCHHTLGGRANPVLSPASTLRETAVRVVLASDAALSTDDVIKRVHALGGPTYTGSSVGNTGRRDLTVRKTGNHPGHPRVLSTHVRGRCLYYPSHLPRDIAVACYLHRTGLTAA